MRSKRNTSSIWKMSLSMPPNQTATAQTVRRASAGVIQKALRMKTVEIPLPEVSHIISTAPYLQVRLSVWQPDSSSEFRIEVSVQYYTSKQNLIKKHLERIFKALNNYAAQIQI